MVFYMMNGLPIPAVISEELEKESKARGAFLECANSDCKARKENTSEAVQ